MQHYLGGAGRPKCSDRQILTVVNESPEPIARGAIEYVWTGKEKNPSALHKQNSEAHVNNKGHLVAPRHVVSGGHGKFHWNAVLVQDTELQNF